MLLMHWKGWRQIQDVKSDDTTWSAIFLKFIESEQCPKFVKADVKRAKRYLSEVADQETDSSSDISDVDQPE